MTPKDAQGEKCYSYSCILKVYSVGQILKLPKTIPKSMLAHSDLLEL